eukprot:gene20990-biopygen9274
MDANWLPSTGSIASHNSSSSASQNQTTSRLTEYKLSSDVVTIQLSTVSTNQSSSIVKLPSFETTLHLTDAAYYEAERTRLN